MPYAIKVRFRKCPECHRNEWWMAPKSAAGKTTAIRPQTLTSSLSRLWIGFLSTRIGWWLSARQVEADFRYRSLQVKVPPDTARCTSCGHEMRFSQAAD